MRFILGLLCTSRVRAAGGGGDDSGPDCGFGTDEYLPYQAGFTWTYAITDLSSGEQAVKEQRIDPEIDSDFGRVLVQVTGKIDGMTVSLVRRENDRVLRFQQEDQDKAGNVQKQSIYGPAEIRIDESADHTMEGASWDESYTETITDAAGGPPVVIATVDHWEVLGVDVACESPLGSFECI